MSSLPWSPTRTWADNTGQKVDDDWLNAVEDSLTRLSSLRFDPKWFGAKADCVKLFDGAMTSGSATLTSASANFTAGDVGKGIAVAGAGASGADLGTTISAYVSATQVTLAVTAGTTVSGKAAFYGTDDRAAVQSCMDTLSSLGGGRVVHSTGNYFLNSVTFGLGAILFKYDNISVEWSENSQWVSGKIAQGIFYISGMAKTGSYNGNQNQHEFQTLIPISAATAGDMSLTVSSGTDITNLGLVAGDYIYLRTGSCIGNANYQNSPDAEVNKIRSISGTTINLCWPLLKDYAQEYYPTPGTPTTLTANFTGGQTSITVASITGFNANDYVTIGDANGVQMATQVVGTPSGNTIVLRTALQSGMTISSGAKVHKGYGITTTTPVGSPNANAAFGVGKVNGITLHNINLVNPRIDGTFASGGNGLEQVTDVRITGGDCTLAKSFVGTGNCRFVWINDVRCHQLAGNTDYTVAAGKGTGDFHIDGCEITGENHAGIVISEGCVNFWITDCGIAPGKTGNSGDRCIAVQTRSGKGNITGNRLANSGSNYCLAIESTAGPRGGIIDNNIITQTTGSDAIHVSSSNWTVGLGNMADPAKIFSDAVGSCIFTKGSGSPETIVNAPPGSEYTDYAAGDKYLKTSGTARTSWKVMTHA